MNQVKLKNKKKKKKGKLGQMGTCKLVSYSTLQTFKSEIIQIPV